MRRLRPPAVPVRAPRRVAEDRRRPAGRGRRPVDRDADRPRPTGGGRARCRRRAASAGTRRASGRPSCDERSSTGCHAASTSSVDAADVAVCVGTKEFVGTLPQWLRLRSPDRDTILYPAIAYPTYEMGAILAGCRPVAVPLTERGRLDLAAIDADDAARALALWVNSPGNPTGACDDLGAVAAWGRAHERPGLLRRVLRRVHVERARPHDPRARTRRRRGRALAVEALEPRRRPARLLRRRPRAGAVPPRGAQARRDDGARTGAGGRGGGVGRRRPRRAPARRLPAPARARRRGARRLGGHRHRPSRRRFLPLVRCRGRLGVRRAPGPGRGRGGQPGRVLRAGVCVVRARRGASNPTTASS